MRGMLDADSLAAIKDVAGETFDVDRFTKRMETASESDISDAPSTYADGATFSGRLKVLKAEERPPDLAQGRLLARLTTPAGSVTFGKKDRFTDSLDGDAEYEPLAAIGTLAEGAVVHEWFVAKVVG